MSFFARVPGGVKWAGLVLGLVVTQVLLGLAGHSIPVLGALHGLNALLLFSSAIYTARRVGRVAPSPATESVDRVATPVMTGEGMMNRRLRIVLAGAATAAVVGPLVWFWQASRLPDAYSIMDMGYPDGGGSPTAHSTMDGGHAAHARTGRSVTSLVADPRRPADVSVTLTARKQRFRLASGREVNGYTLNGQSPGPVIRATEGQMVEVRLVNESVPTGITLHWHGLDVPNAADGVAGVTQDAVRVGDEFTYRFVVDQAGTFWYHSHQISHEQVRDGLLGALVVTRRRRGPRTWSTWWQLAHLYDGVRTINGSETDVPVEVPPGRRARVRIVNSDNGPMSAWVAGAPFRLVAIDGTDLSGPTPVADTSVLVTAGGRADLEVTTPRDGTPVRVHLGGPVGVVLGPPSSSGVASVPAAPGVQARHNRGPAELRRHGAARLRPGSGGPAVPVRHRASAGLRQRAAGSVLDHQRPHVPRRAYVRRGRG